MSGPSSPTAGAAGLAPTLPTITTVVVDATVSATPQAGDADNSPLSRPSSFGSFHGTSSPCSDFPPHSASSSIGSFVQVTHPESPTEAAGSGSSRDSSPDSPLPALLPLAFGSRSRLTESPRASPIHLRRSMSSISSTGSERPLSMSGGRLPGSSTDDLLFGASGTHGASSRPVSAMLSDSTSVRSDSSIDPSAATTPGGDSSMFIGTVHNSPPMSGDHVPLNANGAELLPGQGAGPPPKPAIALALTDYLGETLDCLQFLKGERIRVFGRAGPGVWRGECQGVVGTFPAELVRPLGKDFATRLAVCESLPDRYLLSAPYMFDQPPDDSPYLTSSAEGDGEPDSDTRATGRPPLPPGRSPSHGVDAGVVHERLRDDPDEDFDDFLVVDSMERYRTLSRLYATQNIPRPHESLILPAKCVIYGPPPSLGRGSPGSPASPKKSLSELLSLPVQPPSEHPVALDPDHAPPMPLLVLAHPRAGGNRGARALQAFRSLLHPVQVGDLTQGGPEPSLRLFSYLNYFRVLVCGGDGSVAWVLSSLDKLGLLGRCEVAILPLGTGNDMARVLGWGPGYDRQNYRKFLDAISQAQPRELDRWTVRLEKSDGTVEERVMNNYFSIGMSASIALNFHEGRTRNPGLYQSRLFNKAMYLLDGVKDSLTRPSRRIQTRVAMRPAHPSEEQQYFADPDAPTSILSPDDPTLLSMPIIPEMALDPGASFNMVHSLSDLSLPAGGGGASSGHTSAAGGSAVTTPLAGAMAVTASAPAPIAEGGTPRAGGAYSMPVTSASESALLTAGGDAGAGEDGTAPGGSASTGVLMRKPRSASSASSSRPPSDGSDDLSDSEAVPLTTWLDLPDSEDLVMMNINSYAAGIVLWRQDPPSDMSDGQFEVVAVGSSAHLGSIKVGLARSNHIAQMRSVVIENRKNQALPIQLDGEPERVAFRRVMIGWRNRARMLERAPGVPGVPAYGSAPSTAGATGGPTPPSRAATSPGALSPTTERPPVMPPPPSQPAGPGTSMSAPASTGSGSLSLSTDGGSPTTAVTTATAAPAALPQIQVDSTATTPSPSANSPKMSSFSRLRRRSSFLATLTGGSGTSLSPAPSPTEAATPSPVVSPITGLAIGSAMATPSPQLATPRSGEADDDSGGDSDAETESLLSHQR